MGANDAIKVAIPALLFSLAIAVAILGAWLIVGVRLALGIPLLPSSRVRRVPWGALSVLAVILVYIASQFAAVAGYGVYLRWVGKLRPKGGEIPFVDQLLLGCASNFGMVLLIPPLLRLTSGARLADLGLTGREFAANVARGVVACLCLLPLIYGALFLATRYWKHTAHPIENMIRGNPSPGVALLAYLMAVVGAPVAEELLFRGVLLGSLWRLVPEAAPTRAVVVLEAVGTDGTRIESPPDEGIVILEGPADLPPDDSLPAWVTGLAFFLANAMVSLIFASLHFAQWPAPVAIFVLSLGLGFVYRRTGSLVAPIAMHATLNFISTTMMLILAASKAPAAGP